MWSRVAIVFVGALLCATSARGQSTAMERFEKKVRKYSASPTDVFDKPKGYCVCINDLNNVNNNGGAGVLDSAIVQTADAVPGRVRVRCMVMKSSADGVIQQAETCDEWVPLAK